MHPLSPPYTIDQLFAIGNHQQLTEFSLQAFRFQYEHNNIYRAFAKGLGIHPASVKDIYHIPFLPVDVFKEHQVITGNDKVEKVFKSSGTTSSKRSMHYVLHETWYLSSLLEGFHRVFGDPSGYSFIALLPGYIERPDSSLIYMVNELMKRSSQIHNAFFMQPEEGFFRMIRYNQQNHIKTMLWGVGFSLLDLANNYPVSLRNVEVIETGGMKGRMEEITREELHDILRSRLGTNKIYSEYGMTELLSQAYSRDNGIFESPPWMEILIREPNDPVTYQEINRPGGINIIDLANIYSCCFIATDDMGKKISPNNFEVLGRLDNTDIRGCNLLFS